MYTHTTIIWFGVPKSDPWCFTIYFCHFPSATTTKGDTFPFLFFSPTLFPPLFASLAVMHTTRDSKTITCHSNPQAILATYSFHATPKACPDVPNTSVSTTSTIFTAINVSTELRSLICLTSTFALAESWVNGF